MKSVLRLYVIVTSCKKSKKFTRWFFIKLGKPNFSHQNPTIRSFSKHLPPSLFNPFMTVADIIQKPVHWLDWFLYDIGLRHERVKLDDILYSKNQKIYTSGSWDKLGTNKQTDKQTNGRNVLYRAVNLWVQKCF